MKREHCTATSLVLGLALLACSREESGRKAIRPARDPVPDAAIARLTAEAERALEEGYYSKATRAASELLQRSEARWGSDAPATAAAYDLLVRALANGPKARDPESKRIAERAVDLNRRLYGPADPRFAASLNNLAVLLQQAGSSR